MPVDSQHPQYTEFADTWAKCRDAHAGDRAIKAGGDRYLPKLPGMERDEYLRYQGRATFQGFTGRTVDAYTGMVFRNEPAVVVPEAMKPFLDDVTDTGVSFRAFAEQAVEDVIVVGRGGILIDHQPAPQGETLTAARAQQLGLRPYWRWYKAEDIINWRMGYNGARGFDVTMVVLREQVEEYEDDEFTAELVVQYRVLDIVDGQYRQRVFRQNGKDWHVVEELFPRMNGQPINYIPFVFMGPKTTTPDVDKPTIEDLVYLNLDHYRTSAEYKHAQFFAGMPTPVIIGWRGDETDKPNTVGPASIIFLDAGADAKYLQTDAAALASFREELSRLKNDMAAVGARILADAGRTAESGEALSIRSMGENSVLASLARSVSDGLWMAMEITREWFGVAGEVSVQLNTDFLPAQMQPQELQAWVAAVQSGLVPQRVFREALRRGEAVRADYSDEEWEGDLENEGGGLEGLPRFGLQVVE